MADQSKPAAEPFIKRGDYSSSPLNKALFVLLRTLDPFLQYSILANGTGTPLLHRLGLRTLPAGSPAHTGFGAIDSLGLSPYRLILLAMTVGSAAKQNYWIAAIGAESMTTKAAISVGIFNTVLNSINNYAFLLGATSASADATFPQPALLVGSALYVVGILTETISELQRKRFKENPKNKGKPYTGGLFKYARHINYGAYIVWRTGYAIAAGGWGLGAVVAAFFGVQMGIGSVAELNSYCEKRYGPDWEQFKRQTKYKLIPGIY